MEFTEDQIKELGIDETQANKIAELSNTEIAELKKDWDGKANENAERIIQGAAKSTEEKTGISRDHGEKIADYLTRASGLHLEGKTNALTERQKELDEKIKNTKGDDLLKGQFEELKVKFDGLQQKEAKFSEWEKEDYKGKWEQANDKLNKQTVDIAFGSVKP